MKGHQIDYSDLPPLKKSFFAKAVLRLPRPKPTVTIRLDPEVLERFRGQGRGYQTRINAILRLYMESQKD